MSKNKHDRSYDKGYNEGKSGNSLDDFIQRSKDSVPLPKGETEDSYDAGYSDGQSDRGSSSNDNYSGSSGKSDSGCFITTATINKQNKPDNCKELTLFREFRDSWLMNQPEGKELIENYYNIAPKIVTQINSRKDSELIYSQIWDRYLSPCYFHIQRNENYKAKLLYVQMVNDLSNKYLN